MELVDGPTLRRIIDEVGGLPVRDVLRIGEQVADALDAAHRAGLVHRDVKPANVLVPASRPGEGHRLRHRQGRDRHRRPHPHRHRDGHRAVPRPEQVNGQATDARTDVYALGLLLFEMLCGHPPFGGDTEIATAMARLTTSAPSVRADRPDAPAALDDIVHRCLARSPDARFESARAVHDALRPTPPNSTAPAPRAAARRGLRRYRRRRPAPRRPPVARPAHRSPPARRHKGRRAWPGSLVLVLIVLGLAAAAVYLGTRDNTTSGSGSANAAASVAPTVVGAEAFDPFGDPPGQEDNADAGNAVDADSRTFWSTEHYNDPLQNTKKGVGLRIDLKSDAAIRSVTVNTNQGGWSGAIYVSSNPGNNLSDWGDPRASGSNLDTSKTFDLHAHGKYILIWLTELPLVGNSYMLQINEVTVA